MTLLDGLILGLVQGLTEFLPVSSTGHLILARGLLGLSVESGLAYDAALHIGTLFAVCCYFHKEIGELLRTLWKFITRKPLELEEKQFAGAVVWGTIPAVALGLLLKDVIDSSARSSFVVAIGLIIGSLLMWYADTQAKTGTEHQPLDPKRGFRIGIFQALAPFPGMSRSGSTIAGAMLNGISREAATRFAFVLSFPILLAAGGISLLDLVLHPVDGVSISVVMTGLVTAIISGLAAIHFLVRYLKTHSLSLFIWYRLTLAALIFFFIL